MKKIIICIFTILLIFSGCKNNGTAVITDFKEKYGINNDDMQELFDSIETSIMAYGMAFYWPDNPKDLIVFNSYTGFCISQLPIEEYEELVDERLKKSGYLSSNIQKQMQIIGRTFIAWIDEHPEYKNSKIKSLPWYKILSNNIVFD